MKRQVIALISNKQSERQIVLSAGLVLIAIGNTGLMAGAQSLDSCLPPEVIPANSAVNYVTTNPVNPVNNVSTTQVPGIVSASQSAANAQATAQPAFQSAQDFRQNLFNSLMGTGTYPQFSGQSLSFNQAGDQNLNQSPAQTLSNAPISDGPTGVSNLITPNQSNQYNNNNLATTTPSQTQTLMGSVNTPSTSQPRTSGGIGRIGGLLAGVAMSGYALANGGAGNLYSAGQLGGSMLNFGFRNGFNF